MHSAADALEKLSRGIFDDKLVDVSWYMPQLPVSISVVFMASSCNLRALPALGPAVGPGARAPQLVQGRNLDAVWGLMLPYDLCLAS